MVSKLALFCNLLLTSAALAAPSSRLESRLTRRRENHRSQTLDRAASPAAAASNVQYSNNWVGAVWSEAGGTFTNVTGTFIVPTLSGNDGAAAIWVGIDGDSCQSAILQAGVDLTMSSGKVSYEAWYEWLPTYANYFTGIDISAGDTITLAVTASSTQVGIAIVENKTKGQTVTQVMNSAQALCEAAAEWIVEDFQDDNGVQVPFADFGSVTFTCASATGPGGKIYVPDGANILDMVQPDKGVIATASTSGDTVTISYV